MEQEIITIIGAGNWGTTLALYIDSLKRSVRLFEPVDRNRNSILKHRENKTYLPGHPLPWSIELPESINQALQGAEYIFIVIPSDFFYPLTDKISELWNPHQKIVNFTKGLDEKLKTGLSTRLFNLFYPDNVAVVSGPTIAREIIKGLPATTVVASVNQKLAEKIQQLLSSEQFRVYTSADVVGVELGGALKNIIALAGGIVEGLGLGNNAKAAVITRGLMEMTRMGEVLGANRETFSGLSGMGDLITTSFSKFSRNRTLGERLARGESLEEIKLDMVEVAEGVRTAILAKSIAREKNVEMPITEVIVDILQGALTPEQGVKKLMERSLKPEIW
ncbi:MAG: NAD(P)H-dependent glycerol-3-phosphate dehydrogenase [bacterium]